MILHSQQMWNDEGLRVPPLGAQAGWATLRPLTTPLDIYPRAEARLFATRVRRSSTSRTAPFLPGYIECCGSCIWAHRDDYRQTALDVADVGP